MIEGTTVGVVAVRPLGSTLEFPGSIIDTYRRGEGLQPGPNCTSWKQSCPLQKAERGHVRYTCGKPLSKRMISMFSVAVSFEPLEKRPCISASLF